MAVIISYVSSPPRHLTRGPVAGHGQHYPWQRIDFNLTTQATLNQAQCQAVYDDIKNRPTTSGLTIHVNDLAITP